jgi:acyl-CoA thioester hydrolase
MRTLDLSEIRPEEIDGLGHMNVRFYMERAQRANRLLLAELGVGADEGEAPGVRLIQTDTYVRYHREQFQGQTLAVNGGVLEARPSSVRAFCEVTNPARGEIAATFIIESTLADRATGKPAPLAAETLRAAQAARIELPDYGRARTIDLKAPRTDLTYQLVAARIPADGPDPMSRRSEWTVAPESCDEHGNLADAGALMFGGWRQPSPEEMRRHGPMTFRGDDGHRLGWASLETRMMRVGQARAGDTLASIGAEISMHPKVRHSRRWLFNTRSGQLVSLNDNVSIALDLDARKAIEIEASYAPEFA